VGIRPAFHPGKTAMLLIVCRFKVVNRDRLDLWLSLAAKLPVRGSASR
jgi:hypothetical protein